MFSLSKESEHDLTNRISTVIENYLAVREQPKPRLTGLISAQEAMDELDIKYKTLTKWECAGLPQYLPPIEETRKVYYKVTDILKFLGVDDGKD